MTLVLGLTGSIATGKSTVSGMFASLGVPVFASDDYVHELYRGAAVAPVEAAFPGVTRDGAIDRARRGNEARSQLATARRLADRAADEESLGCGIPRSGQRASGANATDDGRCRRHRAGARDRHTHD